MNYRRRARLAERCFMFRYEQRSRGDARCRRKACADVEELSRGHIRVTAQGCQQCLGNNAGVVPMTGHPLQDRVTLGSCLLNSCAGRRVETSHASEACILLINLVETLLNPGK